MGREQDFINAAKNGNVAQIERILSQRNRRSGIHSFISRNVSANFQDDMGYTALHYASMNGHKSAVELLLKYDASANIPDNSGNSPLHLAAFNGHAEVARILINLGPSRANVNEQNGTEDTAMHSAAQYDHNQVVAVLLENHGDPFIRNCRQESALDLAAQYGRMEPVKLLLSYHPNLLQSFAKTHTPLHLAARNGHVNIVSFLLSCGMDVNTKCDSGTALHDAALFGKLEVVNLLLQCGIDLQVKNKDDLTVMDLLMTHPSTRTQEISKTIYRAWTSNSSMYDHSQSQKDNTLPRMPLGDSLTRSHTAISRRSTHTDYDTPNVFLSSQPESGGSLKRSDTYDVVSVSRSRKEFMREMSYDSVPEPKPVEEQDQRAPYDSHKNGVIPPDKEQTLPEGYYLLQGVDMGLQATSNAPILSQEEVKEGYSILRTPIVSTTKDPFPVSDMVGRDNISYAIVGPSGQSSASQDELHSEAQEKVQQPGLYDYVGHAEPTISSNNGQWDLVQGQTNPTMKEEGRKSEVQDQGQENTDHGFYDFVGSSQQQSDKKSEKSSKGVSRSSTKRTSPDAFTPQGTYDLVNIPSRPTSTKPPRPAEKQCLVTAQLQDCYNTVSLPPRKMTSELQTSDISLEEETFVEGKIYEPVAELEQARHGSDNHCPLDIPDYEQVTIHAIRKQHSEKGRSQGNEEQAFAFLPGYEAMGPSELSMEAVDGDYEIVSLPSYNSYVNLTPPQVSDTHRSGSLTELPITGIQQKRTGSVASQDDPSSTYVVPPARRSPNLNKENVHVAPLTQNTATLQGPSIYEIPPPTHGTHGKSCDQPLPSRTIQSPVCDVSYPSHGVDAPIYDQPPSGTLATYEIAPTPRPRTKVPPETLDLTRRRSNKREAPSTPQGNEDAALPALPLRPQEPQVPLEALDLTRRTSSRREAPSTPQGNEDVALPPLPPRPKEPQVQPLIEKEYNTPQIPPRRMNEYSQVTIGSVKQAPTSINKQVLSRSGSLPLKQDAYEEVRPEGPTISARGEPINWSRIQSSGLKNDGGEYCALSAIAVGTMGPPPILPRRASPPPILPRRASDTCSSTSSVPSDNLLSPDFPPPSPLVAEQEIHRVLTEHKSHTPSVEAITGNPSEYAIVKKTRKSKESFDSVSSEELAFHNHPPPLSQRVDSLCDGEFEPGFKANSRLLVPDEQQDPFTFLPSAEVSVTLCRTSDRNSFEDLHNKFSAHSSRENLTDEAGKQEDKEHKGGALIYENVLFKKSEPPRSQRHSSSGVECRSNSLDSSTANPELYRLSSLSSESPLDETAEWKKIEEFLSSIGQIEMPEALEDQIADAGKAKTVGEWLHALHLSEYESPLVSNGFDDLEFMNCDILEDQDLFEIGIVDPAHRKIILEAVKSLPIPSWKDSSVQASHDPSSLTEWLESIRLPEYFQTFNHNGYVTMERIKLLWELELTAVLEINSLGHRKRMLASLRELVGRDSDDHQEAVFEGNVDLEAKLAELRVYCPDETKQDKPVYNSAGDALDMKDAAEKMRKGESVGLMNSRDNKPKKGKWKHDPTVLINGSANYTISYLGSQLVKTITGIESTVAACKKMKASTAKLQKLPSVQLSVSVSGIKFIDARSQILVSFHDVKNISYITQDPEEKQVFAYIAKDTGTAKHYCHVFKAPLNELSDEITMTIGQAFELAYQQYMHIQSRLEANERRS